MEKEHFEVLLEDILGRFELVLEGQAGLKKEIDDVREDLHEKADMLAFLIDSVNRKIDEKTTALDRKIDKRTNAIEQRLDSVEQKLDKLAADFAEHRADTEAHSGYVVYEK